MPRAWIPKKFDHPACPALGDLFLIRGDLNFVIECADYLLGRVAVFGDLRVLQALAFPDRAVLHAAVIAYRRCFVSGVRNRLAPPTGEFEFGNSDGYHSYFVELANKHIAHSVNAFETHSVGVTIGEDENGNIAIGGVHLGGSGSGGASEHHVMALRELCILLLEKQVGPEEERLKTEILAAFHALPAETIKNLPDALAIYEPGDVGTSRPNSRVKATKGTA